MIAGRMTPAGRRRGDGTEVAYVMNETGVVQVLSTVQADAVGMALVVPPQTRPLWIDFAMHVKETAAPAAGASGVADAQLWDENDFIWGWAPVGFESGSGASISQTMKGPIRIGPTTTTKTFRLRVVKGGSANFAGQISHGAIAAAFRSWMAAYVR